MTLRILNSLARRNEVTLKIVLDVETKMKDNAAGCVTLYRVYKRG